MPEFPFEDYCGGFVPDGVEIEWDEDEDGEDVHGHEWSHRRQ